MNARPSWWLPHSIVRHPEMLDGLMQGADRDLVKIWQKMNAPYFDLHLRKTKTVSARAIANGRDEGVTKLPFDDSPEAHGHGKILGGGMVGTHAGDMIGEIALSRRANHSPEACARWPG